MVCVVNLSLHITKEARWNRTAPTTPESKPDGTDQKTNTPEKKADEQKSETAKKSGAPNTGDESNAILWIGLIAVSAVGVTVLRLNKKNR